MALFYSDALFRMWLCHGSVYTIHYAPSQPNALCTMHPCTLSIHCDVHSMQCKRWITTSNISVPSSTHATNNERCALAQFLDCLLCRCWNGLFIFWDTVPPLGSTILIWKIPYEKSRIIKLKKWTNEHNKINNISWTFATHNIRNGFDGGGDDTSISNARIW